MTVTELYSCGCKKIDDTLKPCAEHAGLTEKKPTGPPTPEKKPVGRPRLSQGPVDRFTILVPRETHEKLSQLAKQRDTTMSKLVRDAIDRMLDDAWWGCT